MQAASPRPDPGTPDLDVTKRKLAAKTAQGKREKKFADEAKATKKREAEEQQANEAAQQKQDQKQDVTKKLVAKYFLPI